LNLQLIPSPDRCRLLRPESLRIAARKFSASPYGKWRPASSLPVVVIQMRRVHIAHRNAVEKTGGLEPAQERVSRMHPIFVQDMRVFGGAISVLAPVELPSLVRATYVSSSPRLADRQT
jgi:hypothetical protein